MIPAPARIGPGQLADAFEQLTVQVEGARARTTWITSAAYPGGPRPTTTVEVHGAGVTGRGENVAFTEKEHDDFVAQLPALISPRTAPLEHHLASGLAPYPRAALEAALIDLGLRQRKLSLADLCGVRQARLRWVTSFESTGDPVARMRALQAAGRSAFKVDVDPLWPVQVIAALTADPAVVILDFKTLGSASLCGSLANALPAAIFEDPPDGCRAAVVARDRPLLTSDDVAAACDDGCLVNLKAPRMGGPIAVLRSLELARAAGDRHAAHGGTAYLGGMFEVGPGRQQARQIAALFCPLAPNDLAPIDGAPGPPLGPSPSVVRLDAVGFGGT